MSIRVPRKGLMFAVAAVLVLFGMVLAWTAVPAPGHPAEPPLLILQAGGGSGTATVWYTDGTREEAGSAFSRPWRPDKPVRMVTVAALQACSITVNEQLRVAEAATANRLAVCVWVAA